MQVDIQVQGLKLTHRTQRHIEHRLNSMLNFVKQDITKAVVRLLDENGRSGVKDKYCRIQIKARGLPLIITENRSSNIFVALESALHRTKRIISRRMKKLEKLQHRREILLLEDSI